ncbi:hypothetical protein ACW2QC_06120 [Virgibacillus sp. FSP13]
MDAGTDVGIMMPDPILLKYFDKSGHFYSYQAKDYVFLGLVAFLFFIGGPMEGCMDASLKLEVAQGQFSCFY